VEQRHYNRILIDGSLLQPSAQCGETIGRHRLYYLLSHAFAVPPE
jgi:hypothetical protein